jgi:hypothetical protein
LGSDGKGKINWPRLFIIIGMVLVAGVIIIGAVVIYLYSQKAISLIKSRNPNLDCKITGFGYYVSGSDHDMVFKEWGFSYECGNKTTGWKDKQYYFLYSGNPAPVIDPSITKNELSVSLTAVSEKVSLNSVIYMQKENTFDSLNAYFPTKGYIPMTPSYLTLPLIAIFSDNGRVYLVKYSNNAAKIVASYNPYSSELIKKEN